MASNLSKYNLRPDVLARLKGLDLSEQLSDKSSRVIGNGAYSDVSKGELKQNGKPNKVVIVKRIRIYMEEHVKLLFEKEIYVWSKHKHENILPLLGYAFDKETGYPLLISEWMKNGRASDYMKGDDQLDPFCFIVDIARGLGYLHEKNVIHSDIKGDNVLISASKPPKAVIGDFGTARTIQASLTLGQPSETKKGTVRWMACELVSTPDWERKQNHTKATDVWAFGMTVYELFTRQVPYHNIVFNPVIVDTIKKGKLPWLAESTSTKPKVLTGLFRKICDECCKFNPNERIKMDEVMDFLKSSPRFKDYASRVDSAHEDSDDEFSLSLQKVDINDRELESPVQCVCFSGDGKYIAVGCESMIHVYNANSGVKEQTFNLDLPVPSGDLHVRSLSFISILSGLASCTGDKKVQIYDMKDGSQSSFDAGGQGVLCLVCSETRLVCGMKDGTARIINLLTRETIKILPEYGTHAAITSIAISTDGHFVATGSSEGARIWNVTAEPLHAIQGPVNDIAFTPSSDMMIIASGNLIKRYDISGSEVSESKTYAGHSDDVTSVAVSHDGHCVMSSSKDGTVRFWVRETGRLDTTCNEHVGEVVSVDFCSAGDKFVTAERSGKVRLWNYGKIE